MAWVEQVGMRSWRVRFPNEVGGVSSIGGFPGRQLAEEYAATLAIQQRQGQWIDPVAGQLRVGAWVEQWRPTVDVAERTEENYRSNLRNHVLPRWGDRRLCDISTGDVHAWTRDLRAAGYAPRTVSSQIKLLSMIMTDAVDARLIALNPVRRRRRGRRVVSPLGERVWADPEHVVRIAEQASLLGGSTIGLLIITGAWTGARWGELTGLQRVNTHLDDGVIVIDPLIGALHESGSRLWLGPPKTAASVRTITLPPFLITLLRDHLETSDEAAVFAGPRGGWLRRSNVYRRALRPAADGNVHIADPRVRALPIRLGLTFHGLRHSHKTWLIDDGMPEIAQARRLGHHLPNRVVETYSHVAADLNHRLLNGLERRWHTAQRATHADRTSAAEELATLTSGRAAA
jgi:integrase